MAKTLLESGLCLNICSSLGFFFPLYMHKRVFLRGLSLKAFLSDSTEPILGHALLYLSILHNVMLMEL